MQAQSFDFDEQLKDGVHTTIDIVLEMGDSAEKLKKQNS